MEVERIMSLDIISTVPASIIERILCLLPLEEAARTSVLSKEWRYKWTKIPELSFSVYCKFTCLPNSVDENENEDESEQTVACERNKMGERCKLFYTIYQILLMRQAPILDFSLNMEVDKTCIEIDHIINYFARNNTLQMLKLDLIQEENGYYWVPVSIFSLHHLTDLYLHFCDLNHQPTFNGFPSLTTLYLKNVYISTKALLHLLSNCPLLKSLTLLLDNQHVICDDKYTVIELFECLPMIEHLTTWSWILECFDLVSVPQSLPISLIHLKYLFLLDDEFCDKHDGLYLYAYLMRWSPNLEKIMIDMPCGNDYDKINSIISEAHSDIWLEHLHELEILGFVNMKPDLEFVKFILAKSPELRRVCLYFDYALDKNEEVKMLKFLLSSPPASPTVKIILNR